MLSAVVVIDALIVQLIETLLLALPVKQNAWACCKLASIHMTVEGGWVRWRCPVAFVTMAPNWYWLTVGQSLLSLQQVRVEGECCYFFCSFTFFQFHLSSLSLSFISSTISSISFLPFSGRCRKMTHKGWHVIKPQHNQSHDNYFCLFAN